MLPPELQPRSYRPYISPSMSAPTLATTFNSAYSPERNPNRSPNSGFYTNRSSNTSSNRSLKNSRFSPSSFVHNPRIAIALVPCAAFLLDLGGTPVIATLTLGLMIAYILDALNFKSGSFFAVWLSLIASQIAFFFSSSLFVTFNSIPLALLAIFVCAKANFLIGIWASLQFKWIQIEYPTIVLALERLLFACVPLTASVLFTWATVSAIGMNNAAYYLMVFNCVFYWLFSIPRLSSFKLKQEVPPPLNYLLVTTTMLGGAAAAGAYALGMIADAFSSAAFTALAVIVSAAGAIVVGFPILIEHFT
ncbi:hypothetical protein F0562_032309 [Nyssa sinensis]|uniref:Uncharacterized protein n=1 Tax=Nyssa sinensis TaxID=561372 RepID=A0A5J5AR43_9ASTE|nr:hypothetical protein F0562_032309 [Nyssa sinensis]